MVEAWTAVAQEVEGRQQEERRNKLWFLFWWIDLMTGMLVDCITGLVHRTLKDEEDGIARGVSGGEGRTT